MIHAAPTDCSLMATHPLENHAAYASRSCLGFTGTTVGNTAEVETLRTVPVRWHLTVVKNGILLKCPWKGGAELPKKLQLRWSRLFGESTLIPLQREPS